MYYQVGYVILGKNVTHLNLSCFIYQNKGFGLEDLRFILSYDSKTFQFDRYR